LADPRQKYRIGLITGFAYGSLFIVSEVAEHRWKDKLAKLEAKIAARNQQVREHPRCQAEAGRRALEAWAGRHKLTGLVAIALEGRQLQLQRNEAALRRALELVGCYVVTTDVPPAAMSA
jgi:hypothetical protein